MTAMLLLGLLVAGSAGTFAGLVIANNTAGGPQYVVMLPGHHMMTVNTMQAFVYGIALTVAFSLGAATFRGSVARMHRRHLLRDAELREAGRVRAERDALAARLGIPIDVVDDQIFLDEVETTTPLPPAIFPWTKP